MSSKSAVLAVIVASAAVLGLSVNSAQSETLDELLPELLETHDRIKAARSDFEATREGINESFGAYLPTLDVTANYGHEHQTKPSADNTSTAFREISATATQLLWDFGQTFADIERSELVSEQSAVQLENTRQGVILEAVTAYLDLLRAVDILRYARQSEENIKRQTGLEESLVERGSGLATDVLQAKAQLAGAAATRIRAEGGLVIAINRYKSVFRREIGDLTGYRRPQLPLSSLPTSLDAAIEIALSNNLNLVSARFDSEITSKDLEADKAALYSPSLELVGEVNNKRNVAGIIDTKSEKLIKVELSYPIISGGQDLAVYNGSLHANAASASRESDLRFAVTEQVRNAWQALQTSRANADMLRNQANISGEFLDLARQERLRGNRSLIDVLNGEINYINSISAAVSAETDTAIAVYNVLFALSALNVDLFHGNTSQNDEGPALTQVNIDLDFSEAGAETDVPSEPASNDVVFVSGLVSQAAASKPIERQQSLTDNSDSSALIGDQPVSFDVSRPSESAEEEVSQ